MMINNTEEESIFPFEGTGGFSEGKNVLTRTILPGDFTIPDKKMIILELRK